MNRIPFKNHVHISGFIGNVPQMRYLSAGDAVTSLRIATKYFWKDADGEWKSATEWHTAVLYRQLAELASYYSFKKGEFIDLEGRIHTREWLDDRQHKHVSREIIAERFHRVDLMADPKVIYQSQQQEGEDAVSGNRFDSQGSDTLEAFKKLT
jgi:single-strand DNA-binding protein